MAARLGTGRPRRLNKRPALGSPSPHPAGRSHPLPVNPQLSRAEHRRRTPPETGHTAAEKTEISQLQNQVGQLKAENEQLRLQLAENMESASLQVAAARDPAANVYVDPRGHVVRQFSIDDEQSERLFYNELEKYIQNTEESVDFTARVS